MTDHARSFKLYQTRGARPPLTAVDDRGNDVLSRITRMDRQYPDDFRRDRIRGYDEEHTLTMKLAEPATANTGTAGFSPAAARSAMNRSETMATKRRRDDRGPSINGPTD